MTGGTTVKARLAAVVLTALARTWRVRVHGTLPMQPSMVVFWHGDMLPVWWAFRALKPVALVSASSDGSLLAALLHRWGYRVIRGSSSRGGAEALAEMTEAVRSHVVLVTPDGPRGPAHTCKPGAVVAAYRAAVPIIAVTIRLARSHRFERSWDRFALPWPFSTVDVFIHDAILDPTVAGGDGDRERIDRTIAMVEEMV
jgi:lysophospholipid acyltransferase (LPLAT)-like uncharacterized protein